MLVQHNLFREVEKHTDISPVLHLFEAMDATTNHQREHRQGISGFWRCAVRSLVEGKKKKPN
jgi:hypothetical protein